MIKKIKNEISPCKKCKNCLNCKTCDSIIQDTVNKHSKIIFDTLSDSIPAVIDLKWFCDIKIKKCLNYVEKV